MQSAHVQRLSPRARIASLTALLAAVAASGWIAIDGRDPVVDVGMPWWLVACLFLLAELHPVHIEIRQEQQSVSLNETAMVVALLFLSPHQVIAARLVAGALVLFTFKSAWSKRAFNVANFAVEAVVAAAVMSTVSASAGDGRLWATAVVGSVLASLVGGFFVSTAIAAVGQAPLLDAVRRVVIPLAATAVAAASLGAITALTVATDVRFGVYLAVIVAVVYAAARSHGTTVQKMLDLEASYRYSDALSGAVALNEVVASVITECRDLLRLEYTTLVVLDSASMPTGQYTVDAGGLHRRPDVSKDLAQLMRPVAAPLEPGGVGALLPAGIESAACVPMTLTDGTVAVLVVADSRPEKASEAGRLRLLTGLAAQAGIAISRALLVERLSHEAHHDALTGLPNRVWFGEQLAARMPCTGTVLLLDLDRFKDVNDTLGHPTGDRVLEIVARRLEAVMGPDDLLARLGGDEFAVFTPDLGDHLPPIVDEVVAAIESPIAIDDFAVHVGASIGIVATPTHGTDETTLLARADIAMYEAKKAGETHRVYRPDDDSHSPERLALQVELRKAVSDHRIVPWYQPKVDTQTGALVGLEALARWQRADDSFVPPNVFVPIAESSGLMGRLTTSIVDQVVDDLRNWQAAGIAVPVAVNLSARDLLDESLPGRVLDRLESSGVPPHLLGFEVTETAFMVDRARVVETLQRLRANGSTLAIDDYGTGYSSMSYLKDLPVDILKIDRAFVDGLDHDAMNAALVKSTIELGHNLGLRVVAEGVERSEEQERLQALDCDECQGYLFDAPMPAHAIVPRLTARVTADQPV